MDLSIRTADWTRPEEARQIDAAAALVYEANPEFYDLASESHAALVANIAGQLRDPQSEVGSSIVLLIDGVLAGISVYYPAEEAMKRRLVSLQHLRRIPDLKEDAAANMSLFARTVEPITARRYVYRSRIGVRSEYRGRRLAHLLDAGMEYDARQRGYPCIGSHVHRANAASMKLHLRQGFTRVSGDEFDFVALTKSLDH